MNRPSPLGAAVDRLRAEYVQRNPDGATLTSVDGRRYTDFLSEFTAGLYGHSHPLIIKRLHAVLDDGISFGGQNAYEASLAEVITARFPSRRALQQAGGDLACVLVEPMLGSGGSIPADPLIGELLFLHLVNAGFWLARRGLVALNLAITDTDGDAFLHALGEFTDRYGDRIEAVG